ncbi:MULTISPECIES: NADPH-dependent FMN reductase [Rhodococcus]|jgi:chromate reductase|nr:MULTISPECIES: NAD(P)H-dependent oxidoreductase [Rhodococcus]MDV8068126.1 NAD(P)H-dependent oxidoreductase [Rhodococcus sp. IEGM 1366]NRI64682.1 NAD(P)H-dependent oxidoreductase [Rhodococcus sp. MS16]ROZ45630.1 NAD(P)H-dependent oxidoreductase [Rhodococcus sp. WS3]MCE4266173.1 NAD(P)H-dependent oxidoreductase [Rhodococcus globerulus]QXW03305.1 NAD(P)H-dependent oxidoreductase [Rhodococcus globerulus]
MMKDGKFVICAIAGSLRADSWNRKLLEATAAMAPDDVEVRITKLLGEIPMLNEDDFGNEANSVHALRAEVEAADALLIATPEYNGGIPGVLKNALDWLSLPLGRSVLERKPVALMGATPGRLGTARSQFELRHTFVFSRSPVLPGPEILLSFAPNHFDEQGRLTDPIVLERVELMFTHLKKYASLNEYEVV